MQWEPFFADLEDQFVSERRAEREIVASEAERLRVARLDLRQRFAAIARQGSSVHLTTRSGVVRGEIIAVGSEWVGMMTAVGHTVLVPMGAIVTISLRAADVKSSLRTAEGMRRSISERMSWGFVLRDLARRRMPITVCLVGECLISGTIDRAGVDHLDVAEHDAGSTRRAREVTGFRLVPFVAIDWVRLGPLDARL